MLDRLKEFRDKAKASDVSTELTDSLFDASDIEGQ
jgi:hypothetical protein